MATASHGYEFAIVGFWVLGAVVFGAATHYREKTWQKWCDRELAYLDSRTAQIAADAIITMGKAANEIRRGRQPEKN